MESEPRARLAMPCSSVSPSEVAEVGVNLIPFPADAG